MLTYKITQLSKSVYCSSITSLLAFLSFFVSAATARMESSSVSSDQGSKAGALYAHPYTKTRTPPLPPRGSNARLDWMSFPDSIILDLMSRGKLVFYIQELNNEKLKK